MQARTCNYRSKKRDQSGRSKRSEGQVEQPQRPENKGPARSESLQLASAATQLFAFGTTRASSADTTRVLSTTLASRLAVPKQSTDDALVRIAGATTVVSAANGFSLIGAM